MEDRFECWLREALHGRFDEHHAAIVTQILSYIETLTATIAALDPEVSRVIAPYAEVLDLVVTTSGVAKSTGEALIAECGADVSVFPTSAHPASWAGICPANNESAGKRKSGRPRPGPKWLRGALTEAANAAARTKGTYLAAHHAQTHHAQIPGRRGKATATGATRHDILIAYYHIVDKRVGVPRVGR